MEEECNNIPKQMKICKIGDKDKIDTEERDNILELLKTPWSGDGSRHEDASDNHKRDREIVISAVKQIVF